VSVSEARYRKLALEDPHGRWELHCGQLRQKPDVTFAHSHVIWELIETMLAQLDRDQFRVRSNDGRVRRSSQSYYIPDVCVVPADFVLEHRHDADLEVNEAPLPLVVEVWSPPTGDYDVETKLPEYQTGGDREIWRIHPYEHTVTSWVRQPDGSYTQRVLTSGIVHLAALPEVAVDLDRLFA
jgi:Uma2 family endonuclease